MPLCLLARRPDSDTHINRRIAPALSRKGLEGRLCSAQPSVEMKRQQREVDGVSELDADSKVGCCCGRMEAQ